MFKIPKRQRRNCVFGLAKTATINPALTTLDPVWLQANTVSIITLHDQLRIIFDCSGPAFQLVL